jgi:putative addiction module CopG family antidote
MHKKDEKCGCKNCGCRTTVRFPPKDWEFIQKMIKKGEFSSESDVIRAAVKEFREKREQ